MENKTQNAVTGFTLVEVILTIVILGIIGALVGPILKSGVKSYNLIYSRKAALGQARFAMERMVDEMRLIRSTSDITTWTQSNLQFNIPNESAISYSLSGNNLLRKGAILADGVTLLQFSYLDSNGNQAGAVGDIRRIGIEMQVSAGASKGSIKQRTQVFLRGVSSLYVGYE